MNRHTKTYIFAIRTKQTHNPKIAKEYVFPLPRTILFFLLDFLGTILLSLALTHQLSAERRPASNTGLAKVAAQRFV